MPAGNSKTPTINITFGEATPNNPTLNGMVIVKEGNSYTTGVWYLVEIDATNVADLSTLAVTVSPQGAGSAKFENGRWYVCVFPTGKNATLQITVTAAIPASAISTGKTISVVDTKQTTSVNDVLSHQPVTITIQNGIIRVLSSALPETVSVYAVNGTMVYKGKSNEIDVSRFPDRTMFLVKVGTKPTWKVIK